MVIFFADHEQARAPIFMSISSRIFLTKQNMYVKAPRGL